MYSKELTINDLDDIKSCIYHHGTIYGIPINHDSLLEKLKNLLISGKVYGCYDNGECVGIASQYFWKRMPVWDFSNVYLKTNKSTMRMTDYYSNVNTSLMYEGIKYAETKECFEFYYVSRDTNNTVRKNKNKQLMDIANPALTQRYEIENMHFLNSLSDIKWDYIKVLIGDVGIQALSAQHKKTLVVRRGRLTRAAREAI